MRSLPSLLPRCSHPSSFCFLSSFLVATTSTGGVRWQDTLSTWIVDSEFQTLWHTLYASLPSFSEWIAPMSHSSAYPGPDFAPNITSAIFGVPLLHLSPRFSLLIMSVASPSLFQAFFAGFTTLQSNISSVQP